MFKKIAIGISCILTVTAGALLAGCGETPDYDELYADKVKVVYELEGGKYLNSTTSVSHYYDYRDGLTIADLSEIGEVTKAGEFKLEGWFTTRTVVDGKVEYSGEWDFKKDTVSKEGVTLYAKWKAPIKYAYEFVYIDDEGKEQPANSNNRYGVDTPGKRFSEVLPGEDILTTKFATRGGYTAIAVYFDAEHKIPYDPDNTEYVPEENEEEGDVVKFYVEYVKGSYTVVRSAEELKKAPRSRGIWLLDDIDLKGEAFSFKYFDNRTLAGNGHTISNFSTAYGALKNDLGPDIEDGGVFAVYISLFGAVENATVSNVKFDNVTVTVTASYKDITKIYVAPLAVSATNGCKFEDVEFTGTYKIDKLPVGFDTEKLIIVTDSGVHYKDEASTETGCKYSFTEAASEEEEE